MRIGARCGSQWNGRNRQNYAQRRVLEPHKFQKFVDVRDGIFDRKIYKLMAIWIEFSACNTRGKRVDRAVFAGAPSFRQSKRENQHIGPAHDVAHGRKVPAPVGLKCGRVRESTGLKRWSERVNQLRAISDPAIFNRAKITRCTLHKLQQLAGCIDIPVSGRENAIAMSCRDFRSDDRMARFAVKNRKASFAQVTRDMLRETASGRCDPGRAS